MNIDLSKKQKGCFIMSFKIPCGGFKLDEKSFSLDDNGVLSVSGGGSVPKPLTYDYMPEGYPSKGIETVTLMEEQEVTFSNGGGQRVYGNAAC